MRQLRLQCLLATGYREVPRVLFHTVYFLLCMEEEVRILSLLDLTLYLQQYVGVASFPCSHVALE